MSTRPHPARRTSHAAACDRPITAALACLMACLLALTTAGPATATAHSRCDNPDGLPVVTYGRTDGHRAPAPALPVNGLNAEDDATTFDVVVDLEGERAALMEAEVNWDSPHELQHVFLRDADGDIANDGFRPGATEPFQPTRNVASGLVEDCEVITVGVMQFFGGPGREVEVGLTVSPHDAAEPREVTANKGDVTVVAVISNALNPYHLEFRADGMPGGHLPLDTAPHQWIRGFPDPAQAFAEYRPLELTLPTDPDASPDQTRMADLDVWRSTRRSEPDAVNFHWVPGTKYVGAVDFAGGWTDGTARNDDGSLTTNLNDLDGSWHTSVVAGNTLGTCPECVIVMVVSDQADYDRHHLARDWAADQDWIDVVIDPTLPDEEARLNGLPVRPPASTTSGVRLDVDVNRSLEAHERGQQHFAAAGNGLADDVTVPHTSVASQAGMDWVATVGGAFDGDGAPSGTARLVDIAGQAFKIPSTSGTTINSTSNHRGGTPLTAASVAGTYARSLLLARAAIPGPSRVQSDGVIASGAGRCGTFDDCALGDGKLTRAELLHHVYAAAELFDIKRYSHVKKVTANVPATPADRELAISHMGHGMLWGRHFGDVYWHDEVDRIVGPLLGEQPPTPIPTDVVAHMTVDSFCRQQYWGDWDEGYFQRGQTALPGPDADRPLRTGLEASCTAVAAPAGAILSEAVNGS